MARVHETPPKEPAAFYAWHLERLGADMRALARDLGRIATAGGKLSLVEVARIEASLIGHGVYFSTLPRLPQPKAKGPPPWVPDMEVTLSIGPAELNVPIGIRYRHYRGFKQTHWEPGEPDSCELTEVRRLDGLQMHDGIHDAVDRWWEEDGELAALQHHRELERDHADD
jgi:hypothetical protein